MNRTVDDYDTDIDNDWDDEEVELFMDRYSEESTEVEATPAVICEWNLTKHGIDTPCKYLSDAGPTQKKCSMPKMLVLRDVRSRAYNGMQIWRTVEFVSTSTLQCAVFSTP